MSVLWFFCFFSWGLGLIVTLLLLGCVSVSSSSVFYELDRQATNGYMELRGHGFECRYDGWVADFPGEGFALVSFFFFFFFFLVSLLLLLLHICGWCRLTLEVFVFVDILLVL